MVLYGINVSRDAPREKLCANFGDIVYDWYLNSLLNFLDMVGFSFWSSISTLSHEWCRVAFLPWSWVQLISSVVSTDLSSDDDSTNSSTANSFTLSLGKEPKQHTSPRHHGGSTVTRTRSGQKFSPSPLATDNIMPEIAVHPKRFVYCT